MKNIGQMMKQAQQMQAKMQEMQARMAELEVTGGAGAGLVEVTLNGKGEMRRIKLQKAVVDPDEVEVLEDLILAAFNDARNKVEAFTSGEMQKIAGGMKLPPGIKLPF